MGAAGTRPSPDLYLRARFLADGLPVLWFLLLTGAVAFPWFSKPGFLFLLDFVWPPTLSPPVELWKTGAMTSLPYEWMWWLLSSVFPTSVVQKTAFSLPLFLGGLSMFHLTRWIIRQAWETVSPAVVTLAAISAGTFYALNPFTLTRALMGQYYLLLASALTPWALLAVLTFLDSPSRGRGLRAGLMTTATMLANFHHLLLLPILVLPFLIRRTVIRRLRWTLLWFLAPVALAMLAVVTAHVTAREATVAVPNPLGPWARAPLAPFTGNPFLDIVTLTSTWKLDLPFFLPFENAPAFGAVATVLLMCMAGGAVELIARHRTRPHGWRLILIAVFASVMAIGVAHPLTEPIAATFYENTSFWIALRDSGKFLSLLALVEAVLLGVGLVTFLEQLKRHQRMFLAELVLLTGLVLALLIGSPAFGGFRGQLLPGQYPESWTAWNDRLREERSRSPSAKASADKPRMLFLPWHQYLPFSFTEDRTVANPAPAFFTNAEVIAGDNSEVGGTHGRPFIFSESRRPLSKRIEKLLREAPTRADFGAHVAAEKIRYVVLATDSIDSTSYNYLSRQTDLRLVFESPELTAWEEVSHLRL